MPPSVPLAYKSRSPAVSYEEIDECGHFALIDPQTQGVAVGRGYVKPVFPESSDVTLWGQTHFVEKSHSRAEKALAQ